MIDTISVSFEISKDDVREKMFDKTIFVKAETQQICEKIFLNKTFNYNVGYDCIGKETFDSLKVVGSISKALKGDNIKNYRYVKNDIERFKEIVEDETQVKLGELKKIGRFDVGINTSLNTQKVIENIVNVNSRMHERLYDSTLLLRNGQRQFCIYDKAIEQKVKNLQVCRFEARLFKTKNLAKVGVRTIEDCFDFQKQKDIFINELNRNFKMDWLVEKNKKLTSLTDVVNLNALENIIRKFCNLDNYRKYLINECGIHRNNVSQHIARLRKYVYLLDGKEFANIKEEIDKAIEELN